MGVIAPNPFGTGDSPDSPQPSPEAQFDLLRQTAASVGPGLRTAAMMFPSSRQRTQGEIINLQMAINQLGNPFSVRRLPFSVLRDMLTDPMIGFAYYYTKIPLMRADWSIKCSDPQIAAAVDEALRVINPRTQNQLCGKLGYGFQPMVKRFKLGQLQSTYRDHRKGTNDPDADLPTWNANTPALLWDECQVLAPEHCIPRWNDKGEFDGFTYSLVPLPNQQSALGFGGLYSQDIPGYTIPDTHAIWAVNERDESFGSIYGSPRTKRAYRYWWSYWYRWALADRIFETSADPVKIVYYPTEVNSAFDPNDPNQDSPTALSLQAKALEIGAAARQGATLALPGDMVVGDDGRTTTMRKWAIEYLENKADFSALDSTFTQLDALKFRAMMLPEEAFVQPGQGQRSARNVATQLGELYQESTVLLAQENDDIVNKEFIPQFIEANFPDRAGITCTKDSTGFGQQDQQLITQIIQLVGQVKGEVLPVDIRELFRQQGIPLLSEEQQKAQEAEVAKEAQAMLPPVQEPEKIGMQGGNAGVGRTPQGTAFYYAARERLDLDAFYHGTQTSFVSSLPNIPPYMDAKVRQAMIQLRKAMLSRYEDQIKSFIDHIRERTTLHLAQQTYPQDTSDTQTQQPAQTQQKGLTADQAAGIAATIVGTWLGLEATGAVVDGVQALLYGIALRAGTKELVKSQLDADVLDPQTIASWATARSNFVLGSIDTTLKKEFTTFLTDQLQRGTDPSAVADAAEKRFDDTPVTHADRVVLAEALPAYNYGQLSALNSAGISQVQAHDASDGHDELTDAACRQRDGEIMTVPQALAEAADEHPAGTLYFTALSTDNLQVLVVDELPDKAMSKNMLAHYDDAREHLLILSSATDEERREFILAIGATKSLAPGLVVR